MRFFTLSVCILLMSFFCSYGCGKEAIEVEEEPIEVEVIHMMPRNVTEQFELGGILEADETAMVTAEISGTIETQYYREGDNVSKGDLLLRFDKEPFQLNLGSAKANLRKAEVGYENSRSEFARRQKLKQEGFLSDEEVDTALRLYRAAEADLDVAKSNLRLARRELKKTTVRAPLPGIIVKRYRDQGELVPPGTALFNISDPHRLRVVVGLSEQQVLFTREKEEVSIHFKPFGNRTFKGHVKRIGIPESKRGGTFPVEVILENSDGLLKPGMATRVTFAGKRHDGIFIVPRDAVLKRLGQEIVYRVEDQTALGTKVKTGANFGFQLAITHGLSAGDEVIVIGQDQVFEGAAVKVRQTPGETEQ